MGGARPVRERRFYIFPGWWVVGGSFLSNALSAPVGLVLIGLFIKPMSEELNWSRGDLSIAIALRTVIMVLPGPLLGPLIDRYGARPIVLGGALVTGLCTIALGWVTGLWQFILLYGIISAVGILAVSNLVTGTAVAKWFVLLRGRAVGISDLGTAVGIALLTPLTQYLIDSLGWRGAWVALGVMSLAFLSIAALPMRRSPEDMGLSPDYGVPLAEAAESTPRREREVAQEETWTAGEAARTPAFWLYLVVFNVGGLAVMGVLAHQIPHITDKGFSPAEASFALSLWAIFSGVSRLAFGFMAEHIPVRYLTATSMLGSALGVLILIDLRSIWLLYLYGVIYGLFRGAYVLLMTLAWAEYYGRAFLGTIRGIVTPFSVIPNAGGPILAGYIFDLYGSYSMALWIFFVCYVIAVLTAFLARRPRRPGIARG